VSDSRKPGSLKIRESRHSSETFKNREPTHHGDHSPFKHKPLPAGKYKY